MNQKHLLINQKNLYNWEMKWLKTFAEKAKDQWYKWVKFNTWDDYIKIPWIRKLDTTWHNNYMIFNSADAQIIKNTAIKELWFVKWAWLMRDLLAWSIVWLSWVAIGSMLKDKFFWWDKETHFTTYNK